MWPWARGRDGHALTLRIRLRLPAQRGHCGARMDDLGGGGACEILGWTNRPVLVSAAAARVEPNPPPEHGRDGWEVELGTNPASRTSATATRMAGGTSTSIATDELDT